MADRFPAPQHYNSARFYTELKDRTLPRFAVAVGSSFGLSAVVYIFISSLGFLTFGGKIKQETRLLDCLI